MGGNELSNHLLLRIGLRKRIQGELVNIVEAHNDVFISDGKVALGKFGRPVSKIRLQLLCRQIERSIPTYLFLVYREANDYYSFTAPLIKIVNNPYQQSARAPDYYGAFSVSQPSCWFILGGAFKQVLLSKVYMQKDGRPVMNVLQECRTAFMFVVAERNLFNKRVTV